MSDARVKLFADCRCELSEAPMWNDREQMLYWRGSHGELYRKAMTDDARDYDCFQLNVGNIGSMVFTEGGEMLLFADGGRVWLWKPGAEPTLRYDFQKTLFNDVLADPQGRIYCGMLAEHYFDLPRRGKYGSLWRLDPDGRFACLEDKIGATPNGIRFSPALDRLYFAETDAGVIYVYDYDPATGALSDRRIFAAHCCPDGIATDAAGNVWVANCRPGEPLLCYDPAGQIIDEIEFPVRRVISVAFGGPDRTTLFVTTAHEGAPKGAHDGGVFRVNSPIPGAREFRARL